MIFEDDDITSAPLPGGAGSGEPPHTAVAAPADDYDDLLRVIDRMDRWHLMEFVRKLRERFPIEFEDGRHL